MMSYDLSDALMYSREVYLYYLKIYGEAFAYVHWFNVIPGLILPVLIWTPSRLGEWMARHCNRMVALVLAYFWTWVALAFHWTYFSSFNYMAYGFFVLFLVEAVLVILFGALLNHIEFGPPADEPSVATSFIRFLGLTLYLFSLLGVPWIRWIDSGQLLHMAWTAESLALGTMGVALSIRHWFITYCILFCPFLYLSWATLRAHEFGLSEKYWLAAGGLLVLIGSVGSHFTKTNSSG